MYTAKSPEQQYPKWPADHPYAYTIGDVEIREAPDLKTGKMVPLIFGLNAWPKPSLKLPEVNLPKIGNKDNDESKKKEEKKEDGGKDKDKDKDQDKDKKKEIKHNAVI